MATKKKTTKKQTNRQKTTVRKMTTTRKQAKKKPTVKKVAQKPRGAKGRGNTKNTPTRAVARKKQVRKRSQTISRVFPPARPESRSGEQSGDLQGLSNVERADSESVDELLEEGNAFEAEVVAGVEDAGNADEREVYTREVPEDDVPGEYLDKE